MSGRLVHHCLIYGNSLHSLRHQIAGVAQLAEQLICNQQVVGSNPIASSTPQRVLSGPFTSGASKQVVAAGVNLPQVYRP